MTTETPEATIRNLLAMRQAMVRNRLRSLDTAGWLKLSALGLLMAVFMVGEGWLAEVLLSAVKSKEDLDAAFVLALLQRLLSLVFLVSLSMLFFSNVTASLSTIYLSRDLDLLLATPVRTGRVFALKVGETLLNSSYMIVLFVTPILIAWGRVFGAGPLFYAQMPLTMVLFILPPAAAAILVTMVLMRFLPARRTHQMLSMVGLMLAISLITLLRLMAPERLLAPTSTEDFTAILGALTVPGTRYLPSTWAANLQVAAVLGDWSAAARSLGALLVVGIGSMAVTGTLAQKLYFRGVTASHEAGHRRHKTIGVAAAHVSHAGKELRLFFRDPTQWSQLLLLGALVVIYVFNITALPTDYIMVGAGAFALTLRDVVAWINVGLAGFVLAAIAMRFVLPALSIEGGAFWVVASSPTARRGYLLRKLLFYAPPMMLFALVLVALSGSALNVDRFTRDLSLATTALVTLTLTTMAVGLGATFPTFKLENPAQFVLTAGGVLYGVLSLVYVLAVVVLEAKPFFWHLLAQAGMLDPATVDPLPFYAAIVGLSLTLSAVTLGLGLYRIQRLEM